MLGLATPGGGRDSSESLSMECSLTFITGGLLVIDRVNILGTIYERMKKYLRSNLTDKIV